MRCRAKVRTAFRAGSYAKRAAAPRTLSYAFIDLMHRTHVLNYWDSEIKKDDPFTPFLRVTNSFNGARALRFDIGFMRKHCSNGVIFEEEVATIKASHSKEALAHWLSGKSHLEEALQFPA